MKNIHFKEVYYKILYEYNRISDKLTKAYSERDGVVYKELEKKQAELTTTIKTIVEVEKKTRKIHS